MDEPLDPQLVLRFGGSLVEQLGAQLYPSVTATVAELISNAWDADAKNVWIQIPFGTTWAGQSEIRVLDDGNGMTREQAQAMYLIVGRKRRLSSWGVKSENGRNVHGRKGIGKLAAFGTAGVLDCSTIRDGQRTDFRLDYDNIRMLDPNEDYKVEPVPDPPDLLSPHGQTLIHGTHIRLRRLKLKKAVSRDQFLRSMSRRFALNSNELAVHIDGGAELSRFNLPTEFRFPANGVPNDDVKIGLDGWAEEDLHGQPLRWWIGFTLKPLDEDQQQGISILANGKMAQRPFKFERSQGTTGQLGQEYLVGEVQADWIDQGADIDDDLIQSNRDQLQLEDARLEDFLDWGRRRLSWALRKRAELKSEKALDEFQASAEVQELLKPFTKGEQRKLMAVAKKISDVPEIDESGVTETMRSVVNAHSDSAVREMMDRIAEGGDEIQESMWSLVHEFGLVDARRNLTIIEARIATIERLQRAVQLGAREVPDIHHIVVGDPWLLDPRWNLLDDEVDLSKLSIKFEPEIDETGNRLDFLFALAPHPPAPLDEVVVVEIKRGSTAKGEMRRATVDEVNKFHQYVLAVMDHHAKSTQSPRVRGLMVAQDYTAQADSTRKSLETLQNVQLAFQTWDRVIDDTKRMHLGWLAVSKGRIDAN